MPNNNLSSHQALALALNEDPFYRVVTRGCESEASRLDMLIKYFALAITEANGIGEVQYAGMDGAAIWITDEIDTAIGAEFRATRTAGILQLLGADGFKSFQAICESMEKNVPPHLNNAWYLSILGVRPNARGQGLAQTMLKTTLARADESGRTSYLETFNPLTLGLYKRLGFIHQSMHFESCTGRSYWLMWRTPNLLLDPSALVLSRSSCSA